MPSLCIHVPNCMWTKALLDGRVKVDGFDATFEPAAFDPRGSSRLRGDVEDKFAATEQVIPDFLVRIARGSEKEFVALPIFVTRGMVHRKFVMRRASSPKDLKGCTIGMGRVLGATSVYLRGLLADHFGVTRSAARWVTAEPLSSDGAIGGGEWAHTHRRGGIKASELIQRLSVGDLDAVIYPGGAGGHWFNWVVEGSASRTPDPYGDLEQRVGSSSNLCFPVGDVESHLAWFKKEHIYPTYHFLGVRKSVAASHPGLTDALVDAFERAAVVAAAYMSDEERRLYEREKELLGLDPNECGLNAVHKKTIERCLDYLEADGLLPRRPTLGEIFPLSGS
jgi:4,5-dihydroxyphthalate decarboxylase